ncbi:two-component sensor histidine kinase [Paenibacillus helianthi]|uniref:Heme sensor protein HssS n=1 Tax=Paenibacillus helianthi TaxID=1349432 RepID=A0ABX3ETW9_9BACL|nr:HAMP domain-containing sensor histidine kinase [Paenibacillus helianthi]OKP88182.1 two-component sensor histidine kinase [Paenibacillus helianthi]
MKTLYVRVVLTFLAVIVISLVSSLLISLALFQKTLNATGKNDMIAAGNRIIRVYEQTNPPDLDILMDNMAELVSYTLQLYDGNGGVNSYVPTKGRKAGKINPESVRKVLQGELYRSQGKDNGTFVGLPFLSEGKHYALFLQSSSKNEGALIRLFFTILLLMLAIGSLGILVAGRYVVKPLQAMTDATKRLAKGDFEVELKINRGDELGTLSRSINDMARDIRQMERMRQDFVSNVSHEIQSPLTSISGFAKALKDGNLVIGEDERVRYLDIIVTESDRLSRLSDNLLKLASLESEHHPFKAESYTLDEQMRRVIVSCEPQWSAKNIRVDMESPSGAAVRITADKDQLNQVWMNLLGNAIKFTPSAGQVFIVISRPHPNEIAVAVSDSGIGIAPEEISSIFERFYKVDKSRAEDRSGNGLGLAISHKIVALHHGSIEVKSTVGVGTTFTVTLPVISPSNSVL